MKNFNIKYLLFLLFAFTSCATPRVFTSLDVLRPAEATFATQARNVLIVNNSVIQPYNVGHNNFSTFSEYEQPKGVTERFDSAAIFCIASLRENLDNKAFFNSVAMQTGSVNLTENFYKLKYLNRQTVSALCEKYNVDAVIALNHILIQDELRYPGPNSYGEFGVEVDTKWSVHYAEVAGSDTINFTDVFNWENDRARNLPQRYDAFVDASILAGANIADRMMPRWEKQERYLYAPSGNALMKKAMQAFTARHWDEAISLWSQAEKSGKNKLKFQAANNKAVAYEIQGEYDKALVAFNNAIEYYQSFIVFSQNEFENSYLLDYWAFLKNRKKEMDLINKQLGE